jgi:DNA modification methylase
VNATILTGDMCERLAEIADESIDAIVTDPPYHLTTGKKGGSGFMGMKWDGGDVAMRPETWALLLRVAKPGAHLVAFGSTRTFHRIWCAIEDGGWEIRDTLMWLYASGFPKSHNLDNLRGEVFCDCDTTAQYDLRSVRGANVSTAVPASGGQGSLLQPSVPEPSAPSQGPEDGADVDDRSEQSRMEGRGNVPPKARKLRERKVRAGTEVGATDGTQGWLRDGASPRDGGMVPPTTDASGDRPSRRSRSAKQRADESGALAGQPESQARGAWPICPRCGKPDIPRGLGTALKPAFEPIVLARKPLVGNTAENLQRHRVGALNIDACRIDADGRPLIAKAFGEPPVAGHTVYGKSLSAPSEAVGSTDLGRWPANVLHDGSEEVVAAFPVEAGQASPVRGTEPSECHSGVYSGPRDRVPFTGHGDSGSAARFFWCPKASRADRNEGLQGMPKRPVNWSSGDESPGTFQSEGTEREQQNYHPTVKPTELMQYLCRLVAPRGATILDPFTGSGSTGKAAVLEGMNFVGIELEFDPEIIERRIVARDPLFTRVERL